MRRFSNFKFSNNSFSKTNNNSNIIGTHNNGTSNANKITSSQAEQKVVFTEDGTVIELPEGLFSTIKIFF